MNRRREFRHVFIQFRHVFELFNKGGKHNMYREPKLISYNGKTQSIFRWSIETGIPYITLYQRIRRGWSIEKSLTSEVEPRENHYIILDGEVGTLHSWCRKLNLPYLQVYQLVKYSDMDAEEILINAMKHKKGVV